MQQRSCGNREQYGHDRGGQAGCRGHDRGRAHDGAADHGAAAAAPVTAAPAPPAPDPAATLQQALASLTTTYHFASTVTLDGTVALVADGDRVGDGSRLTLTSNDGNVAYVITPDGSWVQPDGGDWQPIDTDPANTDPISALQAPASVQLTSNDGTTAHLAVAVAPAPLGARPAMRRCNSTWPSPATRSPR